MKSFAHLQHGTSAATMKPDQRMEVPDMFRRKKDKRIVELSLDEVRLMREALLTFRNKLLSAGKPTEDVNELIIKVMK